MTSGILYFSILCITEQMEKGVVSGSTLPEQTADPDAVDTKKPDVPDGLPTAGGDGADEDIGTKEAELPASTAL